MSQMIALSWVKTESAKSAHNLLTAQTNFLILEIVLTTVLIYTGMQPGLDFDDM